MKNITLKTKENGQFGKTALSQLEDAGLANYVANNVYYFNRERDVFVRCSNDRDIHQAVLRVLVSLNYEDAIRISNNLDFFEIDQTMEESYL